MEVERKQGDGLSFRREKEENESAHWTAKSQRGRAIDAKKARIHSRWNKKREKAKDSADESLQEADWEGARKGMRKSWSREKEKLFCGPKERKKRTKAENLICVCCEKLQSAFQAFLSNAALLLFWCYCS